jgi:hypothetical protein
MRWWLLGGVVLLVIGMWCAGCRTVAPAVTQCPTVAQMSAGSFDFVAARAMYCSCPNSRYVAEHLCDPVPSLEERIRLEQK